MLAGADVAVRPQHGELHDQGFSTPGMLLSSRPGLLGGEEIVELLTALVSGIRPLGTQPLAVAGVSDLAGNPTSFTPSGG